MNTSDGMRRPSMVLALSSLAHFVNDGTSFFVPVIAALLGPFRGFTAEEVTILFVVYYATSSLLGLVIGWWADRHGRPSDLMPPGIGLLAVGLFLFYLVLAGFGGSAGYAIALVAGAVTGFATSFYHPLGASLIQRAYDPARRGTALGVNGAFGSLGRALYPFLFFVATLALATSDSILLFVAVSALAAVFIQLGVRPQRDPQHRAAASAVPGGARGALTSGIARLTALAFLRSLASQGVAVWIPIYLTVARGVGAGGELGLAVTVMYVGGILGQPFFGLAAGRLDRRLLIGVSSAGAALGILAYLSTAGVVASACLFAVGFFTFSAFPLLMTLSSDYVPGGSSSLANALVFGVGSGGGGTVGPLVVGAIVAAGYDRLPLAFEVMAVLGLIAACLVVILPRVGPTRGRVMFG